jgi:hypothetical protein
MMPPSYKAICHYRSGELLYLYESKIDIFYITCTVKPVLRGHLWNKEKVVFQDRLPLKRGSIHMKFSMTGQEKGDLLIQVTAWAGLTVFQLLSNYI